MRYSVGTVSYGNTTVVKKKEVNPCITTNDLLNRKAKAERENSTAGKAVSCLKIIEHD